MRIAYYHEHSDGKTTGIFKKLVAQTNEWARQGHDVGMFNLSANDTHVEWLESLRPDVQLFQTVWPNRLARFWLMDQVIRQMLEWQPEIVYRRYGPYYPSFERVFGHVPIVTEHNGSELIQTRQASLRRYLYGKTTRSRLHQNIAGSVFVSHELARSPTFAHLPKIVIPNGIALDRYPTLHAPTNNQPHLVFLGNTRIMHGIDKIISLAHHFPQWRFDLIGPTVADFDVDLPDNVITHGFLPEQDYLPILQQADVAIGVLAMYRVGVAEISAIKTLEYVARGLPIITGCKDTSFMEPVDFILELPNTENNVIENFDRIEAFAYSWMGKRVSREAISHIEVAQTEDQRLGFLASVLRKS